MRIFFFKQQLQLCVSSIQTWLNCKVLTGKGIAAFLLAVASYFLSQTSRLHPAFALQELLLPEKYVLSNTKESHSLLATK